jgi:two-component system chemotaxis response regulator CheY
MKKVLIVDDSLSIRESMKEILSALTVCETAANGQEAVNLIKQNQGLGDDFGLVIMDIIMPEKDGLTAIKEIRDFESLMGWSGNDALTIIVATTIKDPGRIMLIQKECGADDFLAKPFTRDAVLKTLNKYGVSYHIGRSMLAEKNLQYGNA